jgi:hypothetical protein
MDLLQLRDRHAAQDCMSSPELSQGVALEIAAMSAARARWSKSVTSRGWYRDGKGLGALHMG